MNQSLAVWEMSPIATGIDRQLMAQFKRLFGYPRAAEGTMGPGGAIGNLTALLAARETLEPKLAEFFARAELNRRNCGPAGGSTASGDWVTQADNPRLRGAYARPTATSSFTEPQAAIRAT